jgi:hypothetical protein
VPGYGRRDRVPVGRQRALRPQSWPDCHAPSASVPRPVPCIRSARSASPADERGGPLHRQPVVVSGQEVIEVPDAGHVVAGDVGNVHGDPPGGESGGIGRLGHAGVTSRMSHDRDPTRRLSCRALPPRRVALLVIAPLTAAKSERHCWVLVAELPRRSSRRFPKPLVEWLKKHA